MRTRDLAMLIGAGGLAIFTGVMLYNVRDMLPSFARVYIILAAILLGLVGVLILMWLIRKIYMHFHVVAVAHHERAAVRHELKAKKQDLRIASEQWEMERKEREAAVHIMMSRVQVPGGGVYLIHPDQAILPHEQSVLALPAGRSGGRVVDQEHQEEEEENRPGVLPTKVLYSDIRHLVPRGHVLVGVGTEGVETKPQAVGACVWVVGLSGTGKTSTVTVRVEERTAENHVLLGIDPHWFKDDSLYHAIYERIDGRPGPYASRFALPMAKTPEDSLKVLKAFLGEFNARKSGQRPKPWRPITLLVDEVGAQMDKATATSQEELDIIELLPSIARICGQEARDFKMGGIFISQQATGLSWLRKVALMVIVHQLLQESEKKLATNNDTEVMKAMKHWPLGRTYIFGVGFQEGPRTVQQPLFKAGGDDAIEADAEGMDVLDDDRGGAEDSEEAEWHEADEDEMPELTRRSSSDRPVAQSASGGTKQYSSELIAKGVMAYRAGKKSQPKIAAAVGISPWDARVFLELVKAEVERQDGKAEVN